MHVAVTLGIDHHSVTAPGGRSLDPHCPERETLRLKVKRDVFLEVVPAIQSNYLSLADFVDLTRPIPEIQKQFRRTLRKSSGAIAKLQAVAGDSTLEAARKIQTQIGVAHIRLSNIRFEIKDRESPQTLPQIVDAWKQELAAFPPLSAAFFAELRNELHLEFKKEAFQAGIEATNATLFAELDALAKKWAN